MYACPVLRPRRDLGVLPFGRLGVAFRVSDSVGSRELVSFRGSLARPTYALCTLRSHRSPFDHATLGAGGWPPLPGRDGYLLGPNVGFQALHKPSSSPKLTWRNRTPDIAPSETVSFLPQGAFRTA